MSERDEKALSKGVNKTYRCPGFLARLMHIFQIKLWIRERFLNYSQS